MDRIRSLIFIGLLVSSLMSWSQISVVGSPRLKISNVSNSKMSFVLPSFVIHGFTPSPESAQFMPRRVDGGGTGVVTPGVGFEFLDKKSGFLFVAAMIKDCYDNMAGTIQLGSTAHLARDTYLGLSMGVYVRETPIACRTVERETLFNDFRGASTTESFGMETECILLDGLSENFMSNMGSGTIDIIPMPFLQFSTALYKSSTLQIDLKVMSNYFLNEVAIGVPF